MTVYLVQKLDWKYDDMFFCLSDDEPVKAFSTKRDAEAYRLELEHAARKLWQAEEQRSRHSRLCIGERGDCNEPDAFFEIVAMELEP